MGHSLKRNAMAKRRTQCESFFQSLCYAALAPFWVPSFAEEVEVIRVLLIFDVLHAPLGCIGANPDSASGSNAKNFQFVRHMLEANGVQ